MEDSDIIISGPEYNGPEYLCSIAEVLIPKLKSHPKDLILQVDCATDEEINCEDFLRECLEIAEGLAEFGVGYGDVVSFSCSNNIRSHVAALGTIFAGAIFAPIDQTLKNLEIQLLYRQFKPKFIICESEQAKEIQSSIKAIDLDCKILLIDYTDTTGEFLRWDDIKKKVSVDEYVPRTVPDPKEAIAVICCSSGSTGIPKGVALSHYSILYSLAITESLSVAETSENFLLTSPLSWVSGTVFLLNSCYFGQARYTTRTTEVKAILKAIEKSKPYFVFFSPSMLLSMVESEDFKKYDVSSVKNVFSAGSSLGSSIASKVQNIWKGIRLCNCYGMSETFVGIAVSYDSDKPDAIGVPLPEIKLKVVDVDTGKSLGANQVGELRVKSKRIMNGYYNNEEATREAFDENGWLRTGDLVYYDEEGVFYFVSRMKEVIQYLSYKISPEEIEGFIIGLPGVKDVAIVPIPHEKDVNHLKALVVKDPNSDISADYIIEQVKENFTERKHLKEGVQFVDGLPRTKVGKLRRVEVKKMVTTTQNL